MIGCGQKQSASLLHRPTPTNVRVSLLQLAQRSPNWASVVQVDQSAASARITPASVAMPPLPESGEERRQSSASRQSTVRIEAQPSYSTGAARTQVALADAQARAIGNVRNRLVREADQLTRRYRALQEAQVAFGVQEARRQAISRYNDSLQSLLIPVAAQRINLNVQIAALEIDARPSNPPTAPTDYWNHLLAERRAALSRLPQPQTVAQRNALEQIGAQVSTARSALQQAADAQVASYSAALAARNGQILARQSSAFQREQSDLLTIAGRLNEQLDQPLRNSVTAEGTNTPGGEVALLQPTLYPVRGNSSKQAMRNIAPSVHFAAQRRRLVSELLDATRRSAEHAAVQLNYKIVDWNSSAPDIRAMTELSKRMSRNASIGA